MKRILLILSLMAPAVMLGSNQTNTTDILQTMDLQAALDAYVASMLQTMDTRSPLHRAVQEDYNAVASILAMSTDDINAVDDEGNTPLHVAIECCETEKDTLDMINLLLKHGANINAKNNKGRTPLINPIVYGMTNIVKLFLENEKTDINAQDEKGDTPLHFAARWNLFANHAKDGNRRYLDIINLLLEKGANINIENTQKHTALEKDLLV